MEEIIGSTVLRRVADQRTERCQAQQDITSRPRRPVTDPWWRKVEGAWWRAVVDASGPGLTQTGTSLVGETPGIMSHNPGLTQAGTSLVGETPGIMSHSPGLTQAGTSHTALRPRP